MKTRLFPFVLALIMTTSFWSCADNPLTENEEDNAVRNEWYFDKVEFTHPTGKETFDITENYGAYRIVLDEGSKAVLKIGKETDDTYQEIAGTWQMTWTNPTGESLSGAIRKLHIYFPGVEHVSEIHMDNVEWTREKLEGNWSTEDGTWTYLLREYKKDC